jgi:phosphoenolpyruvate synthase/pyruvate phosphate dikinase
MASRATAIFFCFGIFALCERKNAKTNQRATRYDRDTDNTCEQTGTITGMVASPGVAEGLARVVGTADELADIQEGEILITRVTAPSWAPVLARIKATVTDIGGMMSHAAFSSLYRDQ